MASSSPLRRSERLLFVAHGVVTLAAAVMLAGWPAAIPGAVGIRMEPVDYLLAYFLAAAEVAIGALSIGTARIRDLRAVSLIAASFALFHLATAALEAVYLAQVAATPALVANLVVRLVVGGLFALVWWLHRAGPDREVRPS